MDNFNYLVDYISSIAAEFVLHPLYLFAFGFFFVSLCCSFLSHFLSVCYGTCGKLKKPKKSKELKKFFIFDFIIKYKKYKKIKKMQKYFDSIEF